VSKRKKKRKPARDEPRGKKRFVIPYWLGFIIFAIVAAGLVAFYIWGVVTGKLTPAP